RAVALLEGIGFRYDPDFNGLDIVRPVVSSMKAELSAALMREPKDVARSAFEELRTSVTALREVVGRAEREEFRIRVHPRDLMQAERFMGLQVRRILLSVFAFTVAMITAILFIALRRWWLLGAGLVISIFMFVIVLFLPTHLFENPLRHARGRQRRYQCGGALAGHPAFDAGGSPGESSPMHNEHSPDAAVAGPTSAITELFARFEAGQRTALARAIS